MNILTNSHRMHDLKTWPVYYQAIDSGEKTFEVRVNDRNFQPGDVLHLQEYDPQTQQYTGWSMMWKIGFMLRGGEWGLPDNLCVMSMLHVTDEDMSGLR
jgi:hypothetical protein